MCAQEPVSNGEASSPDLSQRDSQLLAAFFRALAEPARVRIIDSLQQSELCVSELAARLELTDSAVSHHLRDLRLMHLVGARRRGRRVYYRLTDGRIGQVLHDALQHLKV